MDYQVLLEATAALLELTPERLEKEEKLYLAKAVLEAMVVSAYLEV